MDKVLAFAILSASPDDIAAGPGGRWARLSWRGGADDHAAATTRQQQQQRDKEQQQQGPPRPHGHGGGKQEPAFLPPRFAPEFDGIDCFETIVSH
ncbi:hypothetical protein BAE44_0005386 [Dichanthelium oligosanthes]|uniref:Uncharacterized protein n=1 Tax=Dichanthelium oligosanthes TaxID=888268 RepID=A0A1E5W8C1_9POAL|nr:hypothetical protein BAE44_0005386 [Dichanthelium oligosanthes]